MDGAYASLLRMQGPTAGGAVALGGGEEQQLPPVLGEDHSALSLHGGGAAEGAPHSRNSDSTEISTEEEDDRMGGRADADAATGVMATGGVVVVVTSMPECGARRNSGAGSGLGRAASEGKDRIRCSGEGWRREVEGSTNKGQAAYYHRSSSSSALRGSATIGPEKGAAAAGPSEAVPPSIPSGAGYGAGGEAPSVSLWRLFEFGRPQAGYFALALLLALCQGAQTPVFSLIFSRLIGVFFERDDAKMRKAAVFWALVMFSIGIASFFVLLGVSFCAGVFAQHLVMRLRREAFAAAVRQEIAYFEDPKNNAGAGRSSRDGGAWHCYWLCARHYEPSRTASLVFLIDCCPPAHHLYISLLLLPCVSRIQAPCPPAWRRTPRSCASSPRTASSPSPPRAPRASAASSSPSRGAGSSRS
jgi:hypothetical protein